MARFQNILDTVGHTPVVRINRLAPDGVNLYVKIEAFNPLGSVKDRLALGVIEAAEQSGKAQARPNGHRGDKREHRHRACDGLRRERLSACPDDGGDLQRRTTPIDALSRGESRPYAGRRPGGRDDQEDDRTGRSPRVVHDPANSRTKPTRTSTPAPPHAKSSMTSPATGSTFGLPATAPAER